MFIYSYFRPNFVLENHSPISVGYEPCMIMVTQLPFDVGTFDRSSACLSMVFAFAMCVFSVCLRLHASLIVIDC